MDLELLALVLRQADLAVLSEELAHRVGETPNLFNHDPVVLDIGALRETEDAIDFDDLLNVLMAHRMKPVAVTGGNPEQMARALDAGLAEAPERAQRARPVEAEPACVTEVVREVPVTVPAIVVDKPLRSGQQVYAKGGDAIVLGAVNAGAEVIADGNVHVYGPLRGRAIAGARGNTQARILTTCLEAELLAIAGTYRTAETPMAPGVAGKPAQVRLVDGKLVMDPIKT
jgi:septum site-determining protein MinC